MYDYNKVQNLIEVWESPMLYYAGCFSENEAEKQAAVKYSVSALLNKSRQDEYRDESNIPFFLLKNVRAKMAELKVCSPHHLSKLFRLDNKVCQDVPLASMISKFAPAEQEILLLKFAYLRSCEEIGEIIGEKTEWITDRYGHVMERMEEKIRK